MRFSMSVLKKLLSVTTVALFAAGCETSSHKTVKTYDYSNDSRPAQPQPTEREQRGSDAQMVEPGEMVAPGEMVPPGEPVVEPRR